MELKFMRFLIPGLLALSPVLAADSGLQTCREITNDVERLDCYDTLAGRAPALTQSKSSPRTIEATTRPAPAQPPVTRETATEESFGIEDLHEEEQKKISSRYDGEFTGWTGRTLFKLENGQVWRQSESGRFRTSLNRPMITIERGAFRSYFLKVEGLNRKIRVKRVR